MSSRVVARVALVAALVTVGGIEIAAAAVPVAAATPAARSHGAPSALATPTRQDTTTTTVVVPRTTVPALEGRASESQAATTRLNRVVIGLLVLAGLIAAATTYFWVRTRPGRSGSAPRRRGATVVAGDGTETSITEPGVGAWLASTASDTGTGTGSPGGAAGPSVDLTDAATGASDSTGPWAVAPAPVLPPTEPEIRS